MALAGLVAVKRRALDLLYPEEAICTACGKPAADAPGGLCRECAALLVPIEGARCAVCGRPVASREDGAPNNLCGDCRRRPLEERAFGSAPYGHADTAAELVYALKFGAVESAARVLADRMAASVPEGMDALTPVPLHRARQRERGYNQAGLLCGEISKLTGLPVLDALRRSTATRRQMNLRSGDRTRNVSGAFEAITPVAGMRLVLVDDVRTTGATARECAKALYEAGAFDVFILTATVALLARDQ